MFDYDSTATPSPASTWQAARDGSGGVTGALAIAVASAAGAVALCGAAWVVRRRQRRGSA